MKLIYPRYFLIAQDSAIGSEHKMKWYFFSLTNSTTLSYTTQTFTEPFQHSSPHIWRALISSFAFQVASSVLSFIILALSSALFFLKYRFSETHTRNSGRTLSILAMTHLPSRNILGCCLCPLCSIFVCCYISSCLYTPFGFWVCLLPISPLTISDDLPSLDAVNSCMFNPSVCSSFMDRYSQSNFSWSWGPHIGWILGTIKVRVSK